ncbi:mammalian ependymin-related protein 1-like [Dysidea avara]|uniref:mammalian ependymin-related protein 1-like n=1 Tax=Dysidea avara TaxID=196820 RepID=UPI0033260F57
MKSVLVLFAFFVFTNAQLPEPCDSPKQWEAKYFAYDRGSVREEAGTITYDEVGERIRSVVKEERNGQVVDAYEILTLYLKRVEYRYDYDSGQCTQRPTQYPFRPIGVPANATALGQGYIGASGIPGAGMLVSSFAGYPREGERFEIIVTADACIPVTDIFSRREGDRVDERLLDFYDVVAPYPDSSVFEPPAACQ